MITPDRHASKKVIARIGHVLPNEPINALLCFGWSFIKKAMPGDSTESRTAELNYCKAFDLYDLLTI